MQHVPTTTHHTHGQPKKSVKDRQRSNFEPDTVLHPLSVDIDKQSFKKIDELLSGKKIKFNPQKSPQEYGIVNFLKSKELTKDQKGKIVIKSFSRTDEGLRLETTDKEGHTLLYQLSVNVDEKALEGIEKLASLSADKFASLKNPEQYGVLNILTSERLEDKHKKRVIEKFVRKNLHLDATDNEGHTLLYRIATSNVQNEKKLAQCKLLLSIDGYQPQKTAAEYGIEQILKNKGIDQALRQELYQKCIKTGITISEEARNSLGIVDML